MELEAGSKMCVYESLYHLPEGIQESYTLGVHGHFGYEDQDSPLKFLWDLPRLPHVMDDIHQAHPALHPGGSLSSPQDMPPVATV